MDFERVRALADAVLLEGYVLYPYRASSAKNQFRWAFGALAPRAWSEAGGCETWWLETQCLLEPGSAVAINGKLRFLQVIARSVENEHGPVERLEVDGRLWIPWDEGEIREIDFEHSFGGASETTIPFELAGSRESEPLGDARGTVLGQVTRERRALRGQILVRTEPVPAAQPLCRLTLRVENLTPWTEMAASRDDALRAGCLASHLLLSISGGQFVSLMDPPEWAQAAAKACQNVGSFPVLVGEPGQRDLVLAAPIILYDHPQLAPESQGDFFDACEIDELLTLRTQLLTDEEKRLARATDPRARALVDRVEQLPPELVGKLHGAIRDLHGPEMVPRKPRPALAAGAKVRLRPGARRTDAQDLLFAGKVATVEKVMHDVDGRSYVAVTVDGDPAAELHRWYGRFHYYGFDEIELLPESAT